MYLHKLFFLVKKCVFFLGTSNLDNLRGIQNKSENKIADLCNVVTETANRLEFYLQ